MVNPISKLLICLWKGCECVFEEAGTFHEHITKHGQEQMQLNLDKNDGTGEEEDEEPLAKKMKLNGKEMTKER
jgi:hypothetical protein